VVAHEHAVRETGQRIVERVVDQPRFQELPVGRVDEQPLRDTPATPRVVGHRERLVADPDLGAVPGDHPVLGAERLAGPPVRVVGGDRCGVVLGVDQARPELGIVEELLGSVAEDPRDLGAHVGEPAAVRHVGVGHIDVDRRGDMLDQHPQPGLGLVSLPARLREVRAGPVQAA
jgi:hypothetical protein